jgi:hypothetical protein
LRQDIISRDQKLKPPNSEHKFLHLGLLEDGLKKLWERSLRMALSDGWIYLDSQMWLLDGEFSGDEKKPWVLIFSSSTIGPEMFWIVFIICSSIPSK